MGKSLSSRWHSAESRKTFLLLMFRAFIIIPVIVLYETSQLQAKQIVDLIWNSFLTVNQRAEGVQPSVVHYTEPTLSLLSEDSTIATHIETITLCNALNVSYIIADKCMQLRYDSESLISNRNRSPVTTSRSLSIASSKAERCPSAYRTMAMPASTQKVMAIRTKPRRPTIVCCRRESYTACGKVCTSSPILKKM